MTYGDIFLLFLFVNLVVFGPPFGRHSRCLGAVVAGESRGVLGRREETRSLGRRDGASVEFRVLCESPTSRVSRNNEDFHGVSLNPVLCPLSSKHYKRISKQLLC